MPYPVVSYTNPASTGTLVLTPTQPSVITSSVNTITVTVNDGLQQVSKTFLATVEWVSTLLRK